MNCKNYEKIESELKNNVQTVNNTFQPNSEQNFTG